MLARCSFCAWRPVRLSSLLAMSERTRIFHEYWEQLARREILIY
jgi:hypothetical protein